MGVGAIRQRRIERQTRGASNFASCTVSTFVNDDFLHTSSTHLPSSRFNVIIFGIPYLPAIFRCLWVC